MYKFSLLFIECINLDVVYFNETTKITWFKCWYRSLKVTKFYLTRVIWLPLLLWYPMINIRNFHFFEKVYEITRRSPTKSKHSLGGKC